MNSKTAMRASTWVLKRRRSSSSHSSVAKKLSHIALSKQSPIRVHELERRDGTEPVSVANQAAAFDNISRSSRSTRFSRRSRLSSSRSAVVSPSLRRPSSSPACLTHLRIALAEASNSRANCATGRPVRANSMIRRRYSGAYGGWVLGIGGLLLPFSSTKPGQLQFVKRLDVVGYPHRDPSRASDRRERVLVNYRLGLIARGAGFNCDRDCAVRAVVNCRRHLGSSLNALLQVHDHFDVIDRERRLQRHRDDRLPVDFLRARGRDIELIRGQHLVEHHPRQKAVERRLE